MRNTNSDLNKLHLFLKLIKEGVTFDKAFAEVYGDN